MKNFFSLVVLSLLISACSATQPVIEVEDKEIPDVPVENFRAEEEEPSREVWEDGYYLEGENYPQEIERKTLVLVKEQEKETIVEDLSVLDGYPGVEKPNFYGLRYIGSSANEKLLMFTTQSGGGGTSYHKAFVLNLENNPLVLEEVNDFITTGEQTNDSATTTIGINSERRELKVLDLNSGKEPQLVYTTPEGKTFMFPGSFGDDELRIEWLSPDELTIMVYSDIDFESYDPNDSSSIPVGEPVTISL